MNGSEDNISSCQNDQSNINDQKQLTTEIITTKTKTTEKETGKKNIILDVDGVMVDGLQMRPGLAKFLEYLFTEPRIGTVSVWTASTQWWSIIYETRIKHIMPLLQCGTRASFYFVWEGNRCINHYQPDQQERVMIKPLSKVWRRYKNFTRSNTLILDDVPITYLKNRGNALRVNEFNCNNSPDILSAKTDWKNDKEFERIIKILDTSLLSRIDIRVRNGVLI